MKLRGGTDELVLPVSVTRLVVLGDPHGDLRGLQAVLDRECVAGTQFVSVGDNVGYADGPTSSELCRRLEQERIPSVLGNHEDWCEGDLLSIVSKRGADRLLDSEAYRWCQALPFRIRVKLESCPRLTISIVHSLLGWEFVTGSNAFRLATEEESDLVFCGHSHGPAIYMFPAKSWSKLTIALKNGQLAEAHVEPGSRCVVDAGTLRCPNYHPRPGNSKVATYAVLDVIGMKVSIRAVAK